MSATKRPIRMSFSRHELVWLLDGLEEIIEAYKYDGGLDLAEDYIALMKRVRERLRTNDRVRA